jgi:hypothetical protein
MSLEPITTTGPTVTVSTLEELRSAYLTLSKTAGGGTILLKGGNYGDFRAVAWAQVDGDQPVIIASADASKPAVFTRLQLDNATNIRIEDVVLNSTNVVRDPNIPVRPVHSEFDEHPDRGFEVPA